MEEERPSIRNKFKNMILDNLLTILLICSVVSGCVIGVIIRWSTKPLEPHNAAYLGFPGELLIRMLKCSATTLILACIIVALGSLDLMVSKRICWQLLVLVFGTKFISSLTGLIMVCLIEPGKYKGKTTLGKWSDEQGTILDIFLDMIRNIITGNMVQMYLQQLKTRIIPPEGNLTESSLYTWNVQFIFIDSMNMLGLIFVAIIVGLCLAILQDDGKGLYTMAGTVYLVSMKVATWVLWLSPGLIFFLILSEILKIQDYAGFATTWGMFLATTHAGFFFVLFVQYPLLLFLFTRENPFKLFWDMGGALVTAYATASSMATMPFVIDGLMKHGLDPRLVRFVVPIAVNINKDGAANFLVIATVFVAQMLDVTLTWGHYVSILFLAAMGSVAAAAVPFSGIVVLIMVLNGLGLSQNLVGGILAVEWINDRTSTLCNIWGNCCQPKILAKWNKKYLEEDDNQDLRIERLSKI